MKWRLQDAARCQCQLGPDGRFIRSIPCSSRPDLLAGSLDAFDIWQISGVSPAVIFALTSKAFSLCDEEALLAISRVST